MKRTERMRPILLAAGALLCAWLCGFSLSTLLELDPDDAGGIWYRRHPEDTRRDRT